MYVNQEYYINSFKGDILKGNIDKRLQRASEEIDTLTFNRIVSVGFDNLTPFQQDKIKKAICIHAEFQEQYGDYIDMPLNGFSAGSISVDFNGQKFNGITTTQEVVNYLKQTGLMCRRV